MAPRKNGALFAVFADTEMEEISASKTNGSIRVRSSSSANKENVPGASNLIRPTNASARYKPKANGQSSDLFNGKIPFSLASPPNAKEMAQQGLGLGLPTLQSKSTNTSSLRAKSIKEMEKPLESYVTIGRRQGRNVSESLGLKEALRDIVLEDFREQDGALANVTEAYTGNGGFHYSPSSNTYQFEHPLSSSPTNFDSLLQQRRPAYSSTSPSKFDSKRSLGPSSTEVELAPFTNALSIS